MESFVREADGIYRLRVPFERIYTSVFLLESESGAYLVDCATTAEDIDRFIVPALRERGYEPADLSGIILTHRHGDHAGGLDRLLCHAPRLNIITAVGVIDGDIEIYPLPGHTDDSVGAFDRRSGTLISGDGLQGAGVDRYRCLVKNKAAYHETVERLKNDKRVENILFSHAYEPWYSDKMSRREAVEECLCECLKYIAIE